MAKKGLGRGLGALINAESVIETTTENEKDVLSVDSYDITLIT